MATKKKAQAGASGTKTSKSAAVKKSASSKKETAKKVTAEKEPAKKSAAAGASAKKATAKKSTAKAPAKKAAAKKTAAKTPAKKAAATTSATKAAAKKSTAKKTAATKTAATKAADKAPAKKAPAKKSTNSGASRTARGSLTNTKATPPSKNPKPKDGLKFGSPDYPFDKAFLKAQTAQLLSERETLVGQAERLRSEADALARDREPGDVQFDDESGEGDTLAVERDMDLARAASAMQTVDEIDAALERIEKGVYGICETSGLPIPAERLEAIPYARERVEYKTRSFR